MSLITGVIGGIMGGHAAGTAANAVTGGANQAGNGVWDAAQGGNQVISGATAAGQNAVLNAATTAQQDAKNAATVANQYLNPYTSAGSGAADRLASGLGAGGQFARTFTAADMEANDPGYQFRLQQGQQALQRSLQASGGGMGGGAMKALMEYNQNLASSEYQNAFNRFTTGQQNQVMNLQNLANAGQAAATTAGNQGIQANEYSGSAGLQANQYQAGLGFQGALDMAQLQNQAAQYRGNMQYQGGVAQANGILGKQNAYNGMLSNIGGFVDDFAGGFMSGLKGVTLDGSADGFRPNGMSDGLMSGLRRVF